MSQTSREGPQSRRICADVSFKSGISDELDLNARARGVWRQWIHGTLLWARLQDPSAPLPRRINALAPV
jgi:hypothetical protein